MYSSVIIQIITNDCIAVYGLETLQQVKNTLSRRALSALVHTLAAPSLGCVAQTSGSRHCRPTHVRGRILGSEWEERRGRAVSGRGDPGQRWHAASVWGGRGGAPGLRCGPAVSWVRFKHGSHTGPHRRNRVEIKPSTPRSPVQVPHCPPVSPSHLNVHLLYLPPICTPLIGCNPLNHL